MAHLVNRRGYYSLEESYRDESGKPRKRVVEYYGKRPVRLRDISFGIGFGENTDAEFEASKRDAPAAPSEKEAVATEPAAEVQIADEQADAEQSDKGEGAESAETDTDDGAGDSHS
jgi:hypothetical protein